MPLTCRKVEKDVIQGLWSKNELLYACGAYLKLGLAIGRCLKRLELTLSRVEGRRCQSRAAGRTAQSRPGITGAPDAPDDGLASMAIGSIAFDADWGELNCFGCA
jgi:hypothetical protein